MELHNTPQHKSFLWHLDFEPFTWHNFYGEQCPPFVTEENKEAWRRYLTSCWRNRLEIGGGGMNGYKMLLKVKMWSFYALIFGGKECFVYFCI